MPFTKAVQATKALVTIGSGIDIQLSRLKNNVVKAPVFATMQARSAIAIRDMIDSGKFNEPRLVATTMESILRRVNDGLEGKGTQKQTDTLFFHKNLPHVSNVYLGKYHIDTDIVGGLQDCRIQHNNLPESEDYREMYASVRASMKTVADDLFAIYGMNTTTFAVKSNEALIYVFKKDLIQCFRDKAYEGAGGEIASGLPSEENIACCEAAIREEVTVNDIKSAFAESANQEASSHTSSSECLL